MSPARQWLVAGLLAATALAIAGQTEDQGSCTGRKGIHPSSCMAESASVSFYASSFTPTKVPLCPTNQPLPLRSFSPAEPRGPEGEDDSTAVMYNLDLRLEILLRGDVGNDAAARAERSWTVQGLNVTRLSTAQHVGSESLQSLLEDRRHDPSLVLMFVDEGCVHVPWPPRLYSHP